MGRWLSEKTQVKISYDKNDAINISTKKYIDPQNSLLNGNHHKNNKNFLYELEIWKYFPYGHVWSTGFKKRKFGFT